MDASFFIEWVERFSYPAVILLLWACGLGAPLSEDLIILTGGTLVAKTGASFPLMAASAFIGQLGGDWLLFSIGRRFGTGALKLPGIRRVLTPERAARFRRGFDRHGALYILAVRFLPGFRAPTYLTAGILGFPRRSFVGVDAAAAAVHAPLMTYLGYRVGPAVLSLLQRSSRGVLLLAVLGLALAWGIRRWRRGRTVRNAGERAAHPESAAGAAGRS